MKSIVKIDPGKEILRFKAEIPYDVVGLEFYRGGLIAFSCISFSLMFVNEEQDRLEQLDLSHINKDLSSPLAIAANETHFAAIQNSSKALWRGDSSLEGLSCLNGKHFYQQVKKYLSTKERLPLGLCINNDVMALTVPSLNQVVVFSRGSFNKTWGCGTSGFAISNNIGSSLFNRPTDVCYDGISQTFYVADSGNHIIRAIKQGNDYFHIGKPLTQGDKDGTVDSVSFSNLSKISCGKGLITVVDDNMVRAFDSKTLEVVTLYISPNEILDIATNGSFIYALEKHI